MIEKMYFIEGGTGWKEWTLNRNKSGREMNNLPGRTMNSYYRKMEYQNCLFNCNGRKISTTIQPYWYDIYTGITTEIQSILKNFRDFWRISMILLSHAMEKSVKEDIMSWIILNIVEGYVGLGDSDEGFPGTLV